MQQFRQPKLSLKHFWCTTFWHHAQTLTLFREYDQPEQFPHLTLNLGIRGIEFSCSKHAFMGRASAKQS